MATYTSFDLQHPKTPDEERDAAVREEARWWDPRRWWSRSGEGSRKDEDRDDDDERTALLAAATTSPRTQSSRRPQGEDDLENQVAPPLIGRQTRFEYVCGEVKCYAKVSLEPSRRTFFFSCKMGLLCFL